MSQIELRIGAPRYPVLQSFLRSRSRVNVIVGPLGSGKTTACVQRILAHMAEQQPDAQAVRPSRWLAVRNTYVDLHATTIKDFSSIFEHLGEMRLSIGSPTFHVRFRLPDGTEVQSEVVFAALDREEDVRKLRGVQASGIWLNEVRELVKSVVDMSDLRHGRYPSPLDGGTTPTWHGIIADTNAWDSEHWIHQLYEAPPDGWKFFRQPPGLLLEGEKWIESPEAENLANLPRDYYLRGAQGKALDWIRVYLGNEFHFSIDGRPVHPQYRDEVHCSPVELEPDPRYGLTLGLDFGRTPACAIAQYREHLARWVVLDEFLSDDMSAAVYAPELKRYLERHYSGFAVEAWGDPAGEGRGQATEHTPIEIVRAAGIPCQPAPSNVPALRRAAIANPLTRLVIDGKPAFLISPRAKIIRRGLQGGFCYKRMRVSGTERFTETPDKNMYSHPVEALEYAMLGGGEGREALRPPEHLRSGFRQENAGYRDWLT